MELRSQREFTFDGALPSDLFQAAGTPLLRGHRLELLENGEVFDALVARIHGATVSVNLTVFMWEPGEAATRISDALLAAAKRGVKVRVVVDAIGSKDYAPFARELHKAGGHFRVFRPPFRVSLRKALARTHRKIAVFDGRIGIIGGFGIRDVWLGDGRSPEAWRDSHLEVEGPAVRDLQRGFAEVWSDKHGDFLPKEDFPQLENAGEALAGFITSEAVLGLSDARQLLGVMFKHARRRVWIATAYFVPPKDFRKSLRALADRGLDVRIVMPGSYNDVRAASMAQRSLYPEFSDSGVRLYEYQPSMIHRKVVLVDDTLVAIGSINLDTLSFSHLSEASLLAVDTKLGAQVERSFLRDFEFAEEITPAHHHGILPLARLVHRVLHPRSR